MSRSGSDKRKLDHVVLIRMTGEMHAALHRASAGGSIADQIRGLLAKELGIENISAPPSAPILDLDGAIALRDTALGLARSMVALKRLSAALSERAPPELLASTDASLVDTRETLRQIYSKMAELGVKEAG